MFYRTLIVAIIFSGWGCKSTPNTPPLTQISAPGLQKLEVTTASWTENSGILNLLERSDTLSDWKTIASFRVLIGRNGMAADASSNMFNTNKLPPKHEGDGCSPAGVFALGPVFSYHALTDLKMPFIQVTPNDLCVDDVNSAHYNTLVNDSLMVEKDYQSFEHMRRSDDQYEYGVWVNYNTNPQAPGNGSCIFLHIYKDENMATSGCTAMSKENMLQLIKWLDFSKHPVLIQMPESAELKTEM